MSESKWWHNGAIYQVYPRTFFDSNNDGMGDLIGVAQKIDYLKDLGIDAIWLSPFYPSPLHDGGYDVANPRDVASELGGLSSFDQLIDSARTADIKVLIDLVPNHFSIDHAWFKAALLAKPGSPERARFHFRDGRGTSGELPPNNWISLFGGPAWTRITEPDGTLGQWYLHIFDSSQPDLNWTNPEVTEDFLTTIDFWLKKGVSGFRVDVAVGLAKDMSYQDDIEPQLRVDAMRLDLYDPENPDTSEDIRKWAQDSPLFDRDEVHQIYTKWQEVFRQNSSDVFAVAEAWAYPTHRAMAYAKSLGQVFNFDFMIVPFKAKVLSQTISEIVQTANSYETFPTWVLSNHDVSRVVSRLGGGEVGLNRARAMATLAHFLPGSVYIYQGEELGLPDANIAPEFRLDPIWEKSGHTQIGRDGARAPIPWDNALPNRGFSFAAKTWLPSPKDWEVTDVRSSRLNKTSTYWLYRDLLALRRTNSIWRLPLAQTSTELNENLLIVKRGAEGICLVNTSSNAATFEWDQDSPCQLLIDSSFGGAKMGIRSVEIPPNGAVILEKL